MLETGCNIPLTMRTGSAPGRAGASAATHEEIHHRSFVVLSLLQLAGFAAVINSRRPSCRPPGRRRSRSNAKALPAPDQTVGDFVDDDLTIRRAAVSALSGYSGSVTW